MTELPKLDLGSCGRKIPGFFSVDRVPPADFVVDLAKQRIRIDPDGGFEIYYDCWPWDDSSIAEIRASHIIEHLPKIHTMNEIYRVLIPGGIAKIDVPCASAPNNAGYFQDPDHCSGYTANSFSYWDDRHPNWGKFSKCNGNTAKLRPVGKLERFTEGLNIHQYEPVDVLRVVLQAVKP